MAIEPLRETVLDHVAHAVPRWQDAWDRYAVELGAAWSSGGEGPGFAPAQLRFANGALIELLMPHDTAVSDFLLRFLAASGPGPHHLTFKVPDLGSALETVEQAGFDPVGVDLSHPEWMEAFLHPRQATGIVIQLAEAPNPWSSPPPDDFPSQRRQRVDGAGPVPTAALQRAVHAVADLDAARRLFEGLLGGRLSDEGEGPDHRWLDFHWEGPLTLRLLGGVDSTVGPVADWLGHRSGRLHHLEFAVDEAEAVPGARPVAPWLPGLGNAPAGTARMVAAEDNAGLALVLLPPEPTPGWSAGAGAGSA